MASLRKRTDGFDRLPENSVYARRLKFTTIAAVVLFGFLAVAFFILALDVGWVVDAKNLNALAD